MEWKIHKLKNLGSDCLASYSYGKIKGDVAFVLTDGKEYKDLNEADVIDYVKKSINGLNLNQKKNTNYQKIIKIEKKMEIQIFFCRHLKKVHFLKIFSHLIV